ncbi:MAG: aldehyde dehydrogenase family protein, partial [Candidatus Sericytochromatia bacterium]
MKKLQNFIDGKYCDTLSNSYIDNYNPSTGKVYSLVPDSNKADIDIAFEAAKKAFPIWSNYTAQERANVLYKIADLLESNIPKFAEAESIDQGKPFKLASTVDIPRAIHNFRFFAGAILHHENKSSDFNNNALNYTSRKPIGVVGLISPWNLPLYLLTWKIAPAIACGNTVIAKPSEFTSMTAYLLGDILNQAGLPKGVCNIVLGTGQNTG